MTSSPRQTLFYVKNISFLLAAYMLLGSKNVSVLLGPYSPALAMATEKHGLPFFVTTDSKEIPYLPKASIIQVYPTISRTYAVVPDLVSKYNWSSVAILYELAEGTFLFELHAILLNWPKVLSYLSFVPSCMNWPKVLFYLSLIH